MEEVTVEVEGYAHFIVGDGVTGAHVATGGEQGAVDFAMLTFLVVVHEVEQLVVVVAGDVVSAVVGVNEVGQAVQILQREFQDLVRKHHFCHQTPCHSIAVGDGFAVVQRLALECVSHSVPQVERAANALLVRVFLWKS